MILVPRFDARGALVQETSGHSVRFGAPPGSGRLPELLGGPAENARLGCADLVIVHCGTNFVFRGMLVFGSCP